MLILWLKKVTVGVVLAMRDRLQYFLPRLKQKTTATEGTTHYFSTFAPNL